MSSKTRVTKQLILNTLITRSKFRLGSNSPKITTLGVFWNQFQNQMEGSKGKENQVLPLLKLFHA